MPSTNLSRKKAHSRPKKLPWYRRLFRDHKITLLTLALALVLTPFALPWLPSSNSPLSIMELGAQPNYAISFEEPLATEVPAHVSATRTLPPALPADSGSTVEFWLKTRYTPPVEIPDHAAEATILQLKDDQDNGVSFNLSPNGRLEAEMYPIENTGESIVLLSTEALPGDSWNHIALVLQPTTGTLATTSRVQLFVNGIIQEEHDFTIPSNFPVTLPSIGIGVSIINPSTTGNEDFNGLLDDFSLSARARYGVTDQSFTPFPMNQLPFDESTLVYWKFNQDGMDSSDNEVTAHLVNNPSFVEIRDSPTHHYTCNDDAQCVQVEGEGDDSCTEDTDCAAAHHYTCNDADQCIRVSGEGADTCETDTDCEPVLTHFVCSDTHACVEVSGAGENSCNTDADCVVSTGDAGSTNSPSNTNQDQPLNRCNAEKPNDSPDIYQIDTTNSRATIYFVPAKPPYTEYVIEYGENGNMQHSTSFGASRATGALSASINALKSRTEYSFRVRAMNECQPGDWSPLMKAITGSSTATQSYYKGFAGMVRSSISRPSAVTVKPAATQRPSTPPTTSTEPIKPAATTTIPDVVTAAYTPPQPVPLWERILNFIFRRK